MEYSLGIDIGGTKVASALINREGEVKHRYDVPSNVSTAEAMYQSVITSVQGCLASAQVDVKELLGIGVGVPGKVDRDKGIAIFQNNLPWANFPIVKRLKDTFGIDRIQIDNDVYVAAWAEYKLLNLKPDELMTYITISTGISSASIINNQFIRGAGFGGEIGFVQVESPLNEQGFSSLEECVSGPGMEEVARLFEKEKWSTRDIFTAWEAQDPVAEKIIEVSVRSMAQGLLSVSSVLDPHAIVFGGSVAVHQPAFIEAVRLRLMDVLHEEQAHVLNHFYVSRLQGDNGLVGAGLLVL